MSVDEAVETVQPGCIWCVEKHKFVAAVLPMWEGRCVLLAQTLFSGPYAARDWQCDHDFRSSDGLRQMEHDHTAYLAKKLLLQLQRPDEEFSLIRSVVQASSTGEIFACSD